MALIGFGSVRPLLIRHDEPWVTCSATQFDSAHQTTMYSLLVKVSRRCCPYDARFRPCRWLLRFRPITSRRCFCRRACVVSILLATLTLPVMRCRRFCHSVSEKPALRHFRCHLGWRFQRRSAHLRSRCPTSGVAASARAGERLSLSALAGVRRIGVFGFHQRRQLGRGGPMPERRDHGLLEGDRTAGGSGPQWLRCGYFPPALRAFASRSKIAAPLPSSAGASALRIAPGAGPSRPPSE
jgi:hypothetical protein